MSKSAEGEIERGGDGSRQLRSDSTQHETEGLGGGDCLSSKKIDERIVGNEPLVVPIDPSDTILVEPITKRIDLNAETKSGTQMGDQSAKDKLKQEQDAKLKSQQPSRPQATNKPESSKETLASRTAVPGGNQRGLALTKKKKKPLFWKTADTYRDDEPEAFVIASIRDFVIYLLFLTITCIVAFGPLELAYNYYANVLSEVITNSKFETTPIGESITFREIHSVPEIWLFVNSVILKLLYDTDRGQANETTGRASEKKPLTAVEVLLQNTLISAPQMRQLRVNHDTCSTVKMFEPFYKRCYDYYSGGIENKSNFGPSTVSFRHKNANKYGISYSGAVSTYGGGGFSMNFTTDRNFTADWLQELEDNLWIQLGTRAILIDFLLFSANANLFCAVKLVFEILPSGGVVTSHSFNTLKLIRYHTWWDFFIFGCDLVFVMFTVYYVFEEVQQIEILKDKYLTNWWNILDFVIASGSVTVVSLGIATWFVAHYRLEETVPLIASDEHATFDSVVQLQSAFNITASILLFLIWMKLFKFSALNRPVFLILSSFGRMKLELFTMTMLSIVVVIGFALLGNAIFGSHVQQFRTIKDASLTLVGMFVGGLYFYDDCQRTAHIMSQFYFAVYIFFVLVLFYSAFIAIIVNGYQKAVEEIVANKPRVYIEDVWRQFVFRILTLIKCDKLVKKLSDNQLTKMYQRDYEALKDVIRRHGYRGLDLQLLLKKYDIKPRTEMQLETMVELYNDLIMRNQLLGEVEEHNKILEQIDKLNKTIEFLEQLTSDVVSKADIVSSKTGRR